MYRSPPHLRPMVTLQLRGIAAAGLGLYQARRQGREWRRSGMARAATCTHQQQHVVSPPYPPRGTQAAQQHAAPKPAPAAPHTCIAADESALQTSHTFLRLSTLAPPCSLFRMKDADHSRSPQTSSSARHSTATTSLKLVRCGEGSAVKLLGSMPFHARYRTAMCYDVSRNPEPSDA
jgi:hypothetical protein